MRRVYAALLAIALAYPLGILAIGSSHAVAGAIIVGTFTSATTLLVALPSALWFIRKGWLRAWHAAMAGAVAGLLVATVFALDPLARPPVELFWRLALVGAVHGAAFWLLAIYRNPALARHVTKASSAGGSSSAA